MTVTEEAYMAIKDWPDDFLTIVIGRMSELINYCKPGIPEAIEALKEVRANGDYV